MNLVQAKTQSFLVLAVSPFTTYVKTNKNPNINPTLSRLYFELSQMYWTEFDTSRSYQN